MYWKKSHQVKMPWSFSKGVTLQLQKKGQGEPILIYLWKEDKIFSGYSFFFFFFRSVRYFVRQHPSVSTYTSKEISRSLPE